MPKKLIPPTWYSNARVYLDDQLILKVGSTQSELSVDSWSGTHPFYTGAQKDAEIGGQLERFLKKYG
uniref:50S ribosomal protein L31 n=1 Tax=Karlodinium veneficum TaxID=407301 RepID=A0A067XSM8_KARVE|nr:ribosomal protein L31 [Karlodinium veneficum]